MSLTDSILSKKLSRKIGRAMGDYSMLADGDNVLVAVSGGVDSCVLAWVLKIWQARAPISYQLRCVYIDDGFWTQQDISLSPPEEIRNIMARFDMPFTVLKAKPMEAQKRTCYLCARNRRALLFDTAKEWGMDKIALGHHLDDLVETLFLNMLYSGNISTMVPKQELFGGEVSIIRPLAYLEKSQVREIAQSLGVQAVPNWCPLDRDSRRDRVRSILAAIYEREPGAKKSLFNAMGNIRQDYVLMDS